MILTFKDRDEIFCDVQYEEDYQFSISSYDCDDKVICECPLKLIKEFDPSLYDLYLLENRTKGISENSIYPVYMDDVRVGMIFPVQSLLSIEHDHAEDPYYLKYAYVAMWKLLQQIEEKNKHDFTGEIYLDDYYDPEQQILVIDQENASHISGFNIKNYTVSLFEKGYTYTGQGNVYTAFEEIERNLRLKSIPCKLSEIVYIDFMFRSQIPQEMEPFAKFHLLYQIVEILINVVFDDKFKALMDSIDLSSENLFEKKDDLNELVNEKKRVSWLFNNYASIPSDKQGILDAACIELLKKHQCKTQKALSDNLYAVRCLIVHKYYSLNYDEHKDILSELNNAFLDVLISIIQTFKVN